MEKGSVESYLRLSGSHELDLRNAISLLTSILEATNDGILVVDSQGTIVMFNKRFAEMWNIPESVQEIRDDAKTIEFMREQLAEPEKFVDKVEYLYSMPGEESSDTLLFKDGRTFKRFSIPQSIDQEVVGRVWRFLDITERLRDKKKKQESLAQLNKINRLMTGRELRMIELKKEIEELKKKLT